MYHEKNWKWYFQYWFHNTNSNGITDQSFIYDHCKYHRYHLCNLAIHISHGFTLCLNHLRWPILNSDWLVRQQMRIVKSFCTSFSDLCGRPAILCRLFETTEKNWIKIKSSNLLQFSRNYSGSDSKTVWRSPFSPSGLGRTPNEDLESQTQGQSSIRAFGRIEEFEKSNHKLMDQFHEAYYMTIVCNRWMSIRLDLLNNLIVLSSCIFAVLGRVPIGWNRGRVYDWSDSEL